MSPEQIRSIIIEHSKSPRLFTVAQICEKYELTRYRLRKLRKEHGPVYRTFEELVLTAIYMRAESVDAIIRTLDYLDHAVYEAPAILDALAALENGGLCVRSNRSWTAAKTLDARFLFHS